MRGVDTAMGAIAERLGVLVGRRTRLWNLLWRWHVRGQELLTIAALCQGYPSAPCGTPLPLLFLCAF